jgi:hypothetical protein
MSSQLLLELPTDETPLDEAALIYARRGWLVFPVHDVTAGRCSCGEACGTNAGKHPRTAHGWKDASLDEVNILNWWGRWPKANIGISTGRGSGLVVLDVDLDKGGYAAFLRMLDALGRPTLLSLVQGTGGGGFHVVYRWPGHRVGLSAKGLRDRFGAGLDLRGDGGYIVAAPSLHRSGRRYQWQTDAVGAILTRWPAALDELVRPPTPAPRAQLVDLDDQRRARHDLDYYWRMVLKRRINQLAEVTSNRNDALNEAAFRMGGIVAIGAPEEEVLGYLMEAGRILSARGDHPMPDRELEKTIRSGLTAGARHPDRWYQGARPAS